MDSMQAIRGRIQSIGSTRQITQSMRLVSTAKVQRCRSRMEENRLFLEQARYLALEIPPGFSNTDHPYLTGQAAESAAVIVISSDRGLCGGYNISVGRQTQSLAEELGSARIIAVGTKAEDYFRRRRMAVERAFTGISETPFFDDAAQVGRTALDLYDSGQVGSIHLVYTRFKSLLNQTPVSVRLLPLELSGERAHAVPMRFEPDNEDFLDRAVPFLIHSSIFGAMLEASCCEQGARITSMDSAVKNADEMIETLTLQYNQARQGAITQEITEIVGGADALLQGKD